LQVELRLIPLLLLQPILPLLFRQGAPLAPVLHLLEVLFELAIALSHLLSAELESRLFLLEHKQEILLPVSLQAPRDVLLTCLDAWISKRR
jgi:hypothetical protein